MLHFRRKPVGISVLILFIMVMTVVTLLTARVLFVEQKPLPSISLVYVYSTLLPTAPS